MHRSSGAGAIFAIGPREVLAGGPYCAGRSGIGVAAAYLLLKGSVGRAASSACSIGVRRAAQAGMLQCWNATAGAGPVESVLHRERRNRGGRHVLAGVVSASRAAAGSIGAPCAARSKMGRRTRSEYCSRCVGSAAALYESKLRRQTHARCCGCQQVALQRAAAECQSPLGRRRAAGWHRSMAAGAWGVVLHCVRRDRSGRRVLAAAEQHSAEQHTAEQHTAAGARRHCCIMPEQRQIRRPISYPCVEHPRAPAVWPQCRRGAIASVAAQRCIRKCASRMIR